MSDLFLWTYSGVNISIPGAGGPDCVHYIPLYQRICETLFFGGLFIYLAQWASYRLSLHSQSPTKNCSQNVRHILLVLHCLVLGIELGFKLASESLIWVLNPCHILTIIQIFILASPPSDLVTCVYRLHMHMMNGPLLALAFPVLNTRLLPFECVVYYAQHILLMVIPVALLDQSTVYSVEPLDHLSWTVLSLSLQVLYHFLVLQPIGLLTGINLNNIICPAVTDPFEGPYYRISAMFHQPFLILILGKCITCFGLTWNAQPWPWNVDPTGLDYATVKHGGQSPVTASTSVDAANAGGYFTSWLPTSGVTPLGTSPSWWSDWFRYQTYLSVRQQPAETGSSGSLHEDSVAMSTVRRRVVTESGVTPLGDSQG